MRRKLFISKTAGLLAFVLCLATVSTIYIKVNESNKNQTKIILSKEVQAKRKELNEKQKIADYLVKHCGARRVDLSKLPLSARPSRELTLAELRKLKAYEIKINRSKGKKY